MGMSDKLVNAFTLWYVVDHRFLPMEIMRDGRAGSHISHSKRDQDDEIRDLQ